MNHDIETNPASLLRAEYRSRQERNSKYSLRAFARKLDLSSGAVSEILQNRRALTPVQGKRIALRLGYSIEQQERFLKLIQTHRALRRKERRLTNLSAKPPRYKTLAAEKFSRISDWHYLALINLMQTQGFRLDEKWMAERLGLPASTVRAAMRHLVKEGFVSLKSNTVKVRGNWSVERPTSRTRFDAVRRQLIARSLAALDSVDPDLRSVSGIMAAIDPTKMEMAKKLIEKFTRNLIRFLGDGERTEVYCLNVQLTPLTQPSPGDGTEIHGAKSTGARSTGNGA